MLSLSTLEIWQQSASASATPATRRIVFHGMAVKPFSTDPHAIDFGLASTWTLLTPPPPEQLLGKSEAMRVVIIVACCLLGLSSGFAPPLRRVVDGRTRGAGLTKSPSPSSALGAAPRPSTLVVVRGVPDDMEDLRKDREENDFLGISLSAATTTAITATATATTTTTPPPPPPPPPPPSPPPPPPPPAIAQAMGIVDEQDVEEGREKKRLKEEQDGKEVSTGRFGGFLGGLTIGTPLAEGDDFGEGASLWRGGGCSSHQRHRHH